MARVGNGDTEEGLSQDLNPGVAAMLVGTTRFCVEPCSFGGTMQFWGSLCRVAYEAGKQDIAVMQSFLLAVCDRGLQS